MKMNYSLNHSRDLSSRGDSSLDEGLGDYSTKSSRKRATASKPGRTRNKPNRDAHIEASRSGGPRTAGTDPRSMLAGSHKTQEDVGEPTERAVPRKRESAQSLPKRTSGKARRRPCVLCGRIFKPTPQSSSTRKYCKSCRPTNSEETGKAVSLGKKKKAVGVAHTCRRCGQPVPKSRKSWGWLCEGCERPARPVSRAMDRRPQSNSVKAVLCGLPGLGKRR